jgi:hypothetical protein
MEDPKDIFDGDFGDFIVHCQTPQESDSNLESVMSAAYAAVTESLCAFPNAEVPNCGGRFRSQASTSFWGLDPSITDKHQHTYTYTYIYLDTGRWRVGVAAIGLVATSRT